MTGWDPVPAAYALGAVPCRRPRRQKSPARTELIVFFLKYLKSEEKFIFVSTP